MRVIFILTTILLQQIFAISESALMKKNSPSKESTFLLNEKRDIFQIIKYNGEKSIQEIKKLKDINLRDRDKKTLLHYAVLYKNYYLTKYLLKKGAKPYLQDSKGDTPLHIAVRNKDISFIKLFLLSPGAAYALFIKNAKGLTPLDMALNGNDRRILSIFKSFLEEEEDGFLKINGYIKRKKKKRNNIKLESTDQSPLLN